jgi:hypothetical protein
MKYQGAYILISNLPAMLRIALQAGRFGRQDDLLGRTIFS